MSNQEVDDSEIVLFAPRPTKRTKLATAAVPKQHAVPSVAKPLAEAPPATSDTTHPKESPVEGDEASARSAGDTSTSAAAADDSITDFKSLGISGWLCGICQSLGMTKPTAVQRGCIPAVLAGKDVIGLAQTGSGKTAAFALPILQILAKDPYGVFALVLTPTR